VTAGSSLGDSSAQARARAMSVETNVLTTTYLGEEFTFLDCPGSIEFLGDALNILPGIDAAIVVCEPDAAKAMMLQPFLKRLADAHVPHLLFVNKFGRRHGPLRWVDAFGFLSLATLAMIVGVFAQPVIFGMVLLALVFRLA